MASRVVFIQGLVAWISFCVLLTVIWHKQVQDIPVHEFGGNLHETQKEIHHLQPPPSRIANSPIENKGEPKLEVIPKKEIRAPKLISSPQPIIEHQKTIPLLQNKNNQQQHSPPSQSRLGKPQHKIDNVSVSDIGNILHPQIPWLPDSKLKHAIDEKPISVYMDWGRGNLAFAFANYRSLESVLAHHPNAKVLIQTVAPSSASMYRYANTLSWTQFKKYLKRGYEVNIEIMSHLTNVYAAQRDRFDRPKENIASRAIDMASGHSRPGESYWNSIKDECCHPPDKFNDQRKVEDSRLLPGHLNFLRMLRLYSSGGVYFGFSFLLTRPLNVHERIVDLGPNWWVEPVDESSTDKSLPLGGDPPACGNEFMLQFPPRDPLLHCALDSYSQYFDKFGEPLQNGPCGLAGARIQSDYEHPSIGQLRRLHKRPSLSNNDIKKPTSLANSWYVGYDGVDIEYESAGIRAQACLRVLYRTCLKEEEEEEQNKKDVEETSKNNNKKKLKVLRKEALEWGGCDMSKLHEKYHGEDHPHRHIFMNGVSGLEQDSVGSSSEEGLSPLTDHDIKTNSLAEILIDFPHQASSMNQQQSLSNKNEIPNNEHEGEENTLGFWLGPPALDGVWKEPAAGTDLDMKFAHVHAGLTKWGKLGETGEACLRPRNCSSFSTTGQWEESPVDLQAAKFRCAPQFIIPGTQKGASTFLFHALSRHPQVVPPLRGAHGYKEAGAYVLQNCRRKPNQIGNRVHRFPFIEQDEPFVSGDGTVHYMVTCPAIPGEILRDNNKIRVVFALREPISRMWSDYRFAAQWYKSKSWGFNDVVDGTLPAYQNCYNQFVNGTRSKQIYERLKNNIILNKKVQNLLFGSNEYFIPWKNAIENLNLNHIKLNKKEQYLDQKDDINNINYFEEKEDENTKAIYLENSLDEGTSYFYTLGCKTSLQDNHNLIKKSLFLFQVRHWLSILGSNKMMIVTTEEVIKNQKLVLSNVLKFIGLCDYKFGNLGKDNVTPFDVRGNYRINEKSFNQLKIFFKPYNDLLFKIVGRDLGWNSKTFDSFKK